MHKKDLRFALVVDSAHLRLVRRSIRNTMHKKYIKFALVVRVSATKIYLYGSSEIAKSRPYSVEWPEYTSVQINFSSPCQSRN